MTDNIKALADKAAEAPLSADALRFSQAAQNLAHTDALQADTKRHNKESL
tara:strand:- start:977 stop:1126 length:150 start_codon:yes stop_codon:yes gene_type:complete